MAENEVMPVTVGMSWFHWHFERALSEAVRVHGKEAGAFAWTAQQQLKRNLPDGHAELHTSDAVALEPEGK